MSHRLLIFTSILISYQAFASYEYSIDTWRGNNQSECGLYFNNSIEDAIRERWDGVGEPPVSISNAKQIVNKWAVQKYGSKSTYHLINYELTSFRGKDMKSNHWIYVVTFLRFDGGHHHGLDKVAVLMDGTIIDKTCK